MPRGRATHGAMPSRGSGAANLFATGSVVLTGCANTVNGCAASHGGTLSKAQHPQPDSNRCCRRERAVS
jgi:hypothetical protein